MLQTAQDYISWLEERSMLNQSIEISGKYMGSRKQWQRPYGLPQSNEASSTASVWFTAYPASTITKPGETIIQSLADTEMWKAFQEIGIEGMHTGPLELAGGVIGKDYYNSIDGGFDRIGTTIDPTYGTDQDFRKLSETAEKHGAVIAGDLVPTHTGKGPDFRLAERNYREYTGIFNMVEIDPEDWNLLPEIPEGRDTINLSPDTVDTLIKKGYILGKLERVIFYDPGVKDTNWAATAMVTGVDGIDRRWIYPFYFKEGQPVLNWLDPSFGAQRLVAGDILNSIENLGARILRLDANGFTGMEPRPDSDLGWSEGHPLAVTASNLIAMLVRKFGGFTFQELNLTFEDICKFSVYGADLSYDFVTRPAYCHAIITRDASFLRLTLNMMHRYGIKPNSLIHALQNHDEITYELVHFHCHPDEKFPYRGEMLPGKEFGMKVRKEAEDITCGEKTPYNKISSNGICATLASICTASLGVTDPLKMTDEEKETVKKGHLLMALFNAMQPGVLALSGWDLVGALNLETDAIKTFLADGDNRWVNRGSFDIMGANPEVNISVSGLPRTLSLYGSLPEQLKDENSFASRLKHMLTLRKKYKINISQQIAIPEVKNPGVVMMLHKLPDNMGLELTALNFGREKSSETVKIESGENLEAFDILTGKKEGTVSTAGELTINLEPLEGKAIVIK
jgi:trehalose synthase